MTLTSLNNKTSRDVLEAAKILSSDANLEIIFNHFIFGDMDEQLSMSDEQVLKNMESKRFLLAKIEEIFGDTDERK